MAVYLSSFYPLCCNAKGRAAISKYPHLKPFIDGSCRREPDFEHTRPCITGLCRPGFSDKLSEGDIIIYITNKERKGNNKLVAILEVIHCESSHMKGASWYKQKNLDLPNNLMVPRNPPKPLDQTHQKMGWDSWAKKRIKTLKDWDQSYKQRAKQNGKVAICKIYKKHKHLINPPALPESKMKQIFNRKPGTINPPVLTNTEWGKFNTWLATIKK